MKEIMQSFASAIQRLQVVLDTPTPDSVVRDAAIQRFEFTVELAWKTIQRFLRDQQLLCNSPKACFRSAFEYGLITDDEIWIAMMQDRNLTVHTYNETLAQQIFQRLPGYLPHLQAVYRAIQQELAATD